MMRFHAAIVRLRFCPDGRIPVFVTVPAGVAVAVVFIFVW